MAREHETSAQLWGTLEELLLACAVNRHGTKSWEFIAIELQNRGSLSWLTPQLCKEKFNDLKRRFMSQNEADAASTSLVPMVDQLRRIRVEELRREVQRHDVSIVSLELKVKRLEEEKERSLKEETDLEGETKLLPEIVAGKIAADDDSAERDERSFNESNSTSQKPETTAVIVKHERNDTAAGADAEKPKEAQVKTKPEAEEEPDPVRPGNEPVGPRVDDDDDNKKQNSDVQSSASLSKKKRRRKKGSGGGAGSSSGEEPEGDEVSPANKRASAVKSEPLLKLLGLIRSSRLGSTFERRQRSQESERYRKLIRQHMDLQTIQTRLNRGAYSDCIHKFYRDLLLLFNNAIIFYRKNSQEHIAAQELRALVRKEMNNRLRKPQSGPATAKPEPDPKRSSLSKPNKTSTLVACGKRSSNKAAPGNASRKGNEKAEMEVDEPKVNEKKVDGSFVGIEEKGIRKKRSKERSVSGRRNVRTGKAGVTKHEYGGNELSSHDALEAKTDKKESVAKKKQGAASFLKRMKQNSPSKATENEDDASEDESKDDKAVEKEEEEEEEDEEEEEEEEEEQENINNKKGRGRRKDLRRDQKITRSSGGRGAREESGKARRGVGRPPKKGAAESTGRRGRENGENEVAGRARKRSRR